MKLLDMKELGIFSMYSTVRLERPTHEQERDRWPRALAFH